MTVPLPDQYQVHRAARPGRLPAAWLRAFRSRARAWQEPASG